MEGISNLHCRWLIVSVVSYPLCSTTVDTDGLYYLSSKPSAFSFQNVNISILKKKKVTFTLHSAPWLLLVVTAGKELKDLNIQPCVSKNDPIKYSNS